MMGKSIDELVQNSDEGPADELVPLGQAVAQLDAARLHALALALLDEQGAVERACPVCGDLVRVAAVVVTGQRTGERSRRRVVLNAENLAQHSGRCVAGAEALSRRA